MVSLWKFDTTDVEQYDELARNYLEMPQDPFDSPTVEISNAPMDSRYSPIKLDFDPDLFLQARRKRSPPPLSAESPDRGISQEEAVSFCKSIFEEKMNS